MHRGDCWPRQWDLTQNKTWCGAWAPLGPRGVDADSHLLQPSLCLDTKPQAGTSCPPWGSPVPWPQAAEQNQAAPLLG